MSNFNTQPRNWLLADFVEAQGSKRVFIEVQYSMRKCPAESKHCKPEFYLYCRHTDAVDNTINPTKGKFTKLATVSPSPVLVEDMVYTFTSSVAVRKNITYFAVLDTGACFVLRRVKISYNYCPGEIRGQLVKFPRTTAPSNNSHPAYADGKCSDEHSMNTTRLLATCTSSGQWDTMSGHLECHCKPGYEFKDKKCEGTCVQWRPLH